MTMEWLVPTPNSSEGRSGVPVVPALIRAASIGLILALTASCKLEVSAPPNGMVVTADGSHSCSRDAPCVIEVNDTSFDKTFVAVPDDGYAFSHWKKAKRHLCGNFKTHCRLFTSDFAGTALMSFLEGDETFKLTPVFVDFNQAYWSQTDAEISSRNFAGSGFMYDDHPILEQCDAGQLSEQAKQRALRAVNEVRALHRLPAVVYDYSHDPEVQQASLVLEVRGSLSHNIDETYTCNSASAERGAKTSNLLGGSSRDTDPASDVFAWTNDDENASGLAAVGHRRTILSPSLGQISYGKVAGTSALKVFRFSSPVAPQLPEGLDFIAFPFGMYPYLLINPGSTPWSISLASTPPIGAPQQDNFAEASVSVREKRKNGMELEVHSLYHEKNVVRPSFMSWMVNGWQYDTEYIVRVTNVTGLRGENLEFEYSVNIVRDRLQNGR